MEQGMSEAQFSKDDQVVFIIALFYFILKFYFSCVLYQFSRRLLVEEQIRVEDYELKLYEESMVSAKQEEEKDDENVEIRDGAQPVKQDDQS